MHQAAMFPAAAPCHGAFARSPVAVPVQVVPRVATGLPTQLGTQCSTCHLRELCLPCGLGGRQLERLDPLHFGRRRVQAGQALYREGDAFEFIYAVRSGTFKTVVALPDGREQVTGFHMAGELMGLEGLASGSHAGTAVALEDAIVCAIPYAHLNELAMADSAMQHVVGRLMSRQIVREQSLMVLLGSMDAEQRLAAFLLNLSQRLKARGYSAAEFHIRMSREEIGSYLGMKLETVSRAFSHLQRQRLLQVDKKHIRILDAAALTRLVDVVVH